MSERILNAMSLADLFAKLQALEDGPDFPLREAHMNKITDEIMGRVQ